MSRRNKYKALLLCTSLLGLLAIYSSGAWASGPPTITVGTPGDFTLNDAMLHGTVEGASSYKVEWGKTAAYGHTTNPITVSAIGTVPFDAELTGLEELTTYHFRVSATGSGGTTLTKDATFETPVGWKVEGAPLTGLGTAASFTDTYAGKAGEGGSVEFRGGVALEGGKSVRFYCEQSESIHGVIGVEYAGLSFKNGCTTQLNGVFTPSCYPTAGITLHLDGQLHQIEATKIVMGPECPFGERINFLNGGFGSRTTSEAVALSPDFEGTSYYAGKVWEAAIHVSRAGSKTPTGSWSLTGVNAGKKFGISGS
jgi:hypothetical protein